jgi:hypothetical protein
LLEQQWQQPIKISRNPYSKIRLSTYSSGGLCFLARDRLSCSLEKQWVVSKGWS